MGFETSQASMRLCFDSRVEARQPRGHARNERQQNGVSGYALDSTVGRGPSLVLRVSAPARAA
jgi:hypothetical protein